MLLVLQQEQQRLDYEVVKRMEIEERAYCNFVALVQRWKVLRRVTTLETNLLASWTVPWLVYCWRVHWHHYPTKHVS